MNENKKDYVFLDLETAGQGNFEKDFIVEIGMYKTDYQGNKKDTFESLVYCHSRNITVWARKVHNIPQHKIDKAPHISKVIGIVSEFMKDCIIVCHNVKFDVPRVNLAIKRYSTKNNPLTFINESFCTLKYSGLSLDNALKSQGLTNKDSHRALADAEATAKYFFKAGIHNSKAKTNIIPDKYVDCVTYLDFYSAGATVFETAQCMGLTKGTVSKYFAGFKKNKTPRNKKHKKTNNKETKNVSNKGHYVDKYVSYFKKGTSIEVISKELGVQKTTVMNHLFKYLVDNPKDTSYSDIRDMYNITDKSILNTIKEVYEKEHRLKPIFEKLNGKVSYDSIKYNLYVNLGYKI